MSITPSQCRGARAMLGWTRGRLVRTAELAPSVVTMFEPGKRDPVPHQLMLIQRTLEEAGVIFIDDEGAGPGVRLRRQNDETATHPKPTGPATDAVKAMDVAIAEHKGSRRRP